MVLWCVASGKLQLAGGLTPSSIWHLQLSNYPDQIRRSIHQSIYLREFGSILPLESILGCVEQSRLEVCHRVQLEVYLRAFWGVCFRASWEHSWKHIDKQAQSVPSSAIWSVPESMPRSVLENILQQRNLTWSRSYMQTSQTLWSISSVLLSTSRCSQAPLELSKVLSYSARVFSGAPETTCTNGGAFRMLQWLTYRIVKFWSSWDRCAGLRETSWAAETSAQLSRRLGTVFSQQLFFRFHNHNAFCLSYLSLLQSQDSLPQNIPCIIYLSLSKYIHMFNVAADGTWV